MRLIRLWSATAVLCSLAVSTSYAETISINTFATGENAGSAEVAALMLTQTGNDVDFVLSNFVSNLGLAANSSTFISDLGFTYDGTLSLTQFTNFGGSGQTIAQSDFSINPNGNFQGGYNFYLELGFPTTNSGGGAQRFLDGESVSWTITNVNVSDFLSPLVSGTAADALAAVHIQSLESGGSTTYIGTGTTVVPIPAAAPLFMSALGMLGFAGWRKRRSVVVK